MSVIALFCNPDTTYYSPTAVCYEGEHLGLCIMAGFTLVVIFLDSLVFCILFYTRNPFSKSYYAVPNNLFRLGKLIIKIGPPVYFVIDSKE